MVVVDVGERHGVVLWGDVKMLGFNKAVGLFGGKLAELVAGDKTAFTQQGMVDVFERRVEGANKLDAKAAQIKPSNATFIPRDAKNNLLGQSNPIADNAGNPLTLHKIQNKYDEHYND